MGQLGESASAAVPASAATLAVTALALLIVLRLIQRFLGRRRLAAWEAAARDWTTMDRPQVVTAPQRAGYRGSGGVFWRSSRAPGFTGADIREADMNGMPGDNQSGRSGALAGPRWRPGPWWLALLHGLASQATRAAAADRGRAALLAAVSHDLRAPLAAAKAAVSGLRSGEVPITADDRDELLATAEESLDQLAKLVASLLDVSRLQAGEQAVFPARRTWATSSRTRSTVWDRRAGR